MNLKALVQINMLLLFLAACFGGGGGGDSSGSTPASEAAPSAPSTAPAPALVELPSETKSAATQPAQIATGSGSGNESAVLTEPTAETSEANSGTPSVPSVQDELDMQLANDVIESILVPKVDNKNLGPADITFDVAQGPTIFPQGNDPHVIYFSYARNKQLQFDQKSFFVAQVDLIQKSSELISFSPEAGYLGQVSRYTVNPKNKLVRLFTQNPVNVLDWDYVEKSGQVIHRLQEKGSVIDHFYHLAEDNVCMVIKSDRIDLAYFSPNKKIYQFVLDLPAEETFYRHVCDQQNIYMTTKSTDGKYRLYMKNATDESAVFKLHKQWTSADSMNFYFINNQLYFRTGDIDLLSKKITYQYFVLGPQESSLIKALPKAPLLQTFEYKLFREAGKVGADFLPLAFRQTKPKKLDWEHMNIKSVSRPVPMKSIHRLQEGELFLAADKSFVKISEGVPLKLGNPGGMWIKSMVNTPKGPILVGNSSKILQYDPSLPWTQGNPEFIDLLMTAPEQNPSVILDFKAQGVSNIKKILFHQDVLFAAMTVVANKTSLLMNYDFNSGPKVGDLLPHDLSDMMVHEGQIYSSSFSDQKTNKSKIISFDAQELSTNSDFFTSVPENNVVKLTEVPEAISLNSIAFHNQKAVTLLNIDSNEIVNSFALSLATNKLVQLNNGNYIGISSGQIVLFRASGKDQLIFNKEALFDLKANQINAVDFGISNNFVFIADKYGDIFRIELPLAKILLK